VKKAAILLFICLLCVLLPGMAGAKDFGVILDQSVGYGGIGNDSSVDFTGALIPRFSNLLGEKGEIYISMGIIAEYENENWFFVPELLRTDFTWLFGFGDFKAGRMYYSDPLGFIATGLFDGARISVNSELGTFSFGAWYTGLLHKKRANIAMTPREQQYFSLKLDLKDLQNTYFAPRRIVSALDWEHLSLGGPLQVRVTLLGQFDLYGGERLHSQYAAGKITLPLDVFAFDLGGCLELIEDGGSFGTALAAELGIRVAPPTPLQDTLSLIARYSSGLNGGGQLTAFLPVSTVAQGEVFEVKLSGISLVSLDYIARLHRTFSAGISSTYFIRSDLETYTEYPLSVKSDGYFLGNEFFCRLMWNPYSDLQLNLGGGVFLPSLGNAAPGADMMWRVEFSFVFGF